MINYFISIDQMFLQDEKVMERMHALVLQKAYDQAEELGAKLDTRYPPRFSTSAPTPAYDEDGRYFGQHVMLNVTLMTDDGYDL